MVQDEYEPPFGHAELLSLKVFAQKVDIDPEKATQELKANGIAFDSAEETLEEIGNNNNISPMNIYLLIEKYEPIPELEKLETYSPESIVVEFSGTGFGNKTIRSICEQLGLDTTVAVTRLTSAGVSRNLNQTMKAAAEAVNIEPIEMMNILLIDGYWPADENE